MNENFEQNDLNGNEPISRPEAQTKPESSANSYGGFGYKWSYDKYEEAKARKKCSSNRGLKFLAVVMSMLFLISASSFGTYLYLDRFSGSDRQVDAAVEGSTPAIKKADPDQSGSGDLKTVSYTGEVLTNQQIIKLAKPSVVGIVTSAQGYFGFSSEGVGSGFIIRSDGYIVTNYHVVEGASTITVITSDEVEHEATLVGYDSLSDVAILKIETETELPAVVIGDSDALTEGDPVIAIGTPAGIEFAGTSTHGMISAVDRKIEITDYYGRVQKTMTVIQTDAPINPGNSGGPLLNNKGQVIGINTLKLANTYEGIGFAIPINGVMQIAEQLIQDGVVTARPENEFVTGKAALGITYQEINDADAKYYDVPKGVLIYQLSPSGAAKEYGLKRGDIIVGFDGKDITTAEELIKILDTKKAGDRVTVKVYRDNEYLEVDLVLGQAS